jgi:crossover junction endodeoxyribonuclease RuvC
MRSGVITVIGIDPGLAATGIGVIRGTGLKVEGFSYGAITTSKENPTAHRLAQIFEQLQRVLVDSKPDLMIVEDVFSLDKYPKSGLSLGKVSGVVLLASQQAGVTVAEVPAREAKQILTGNGNADKAQLERAVRRILNLNTPIRPVHASDALGLAIVGLYRYPNYSAAACRSKSG